MLLIFISNFLQIVILGTMAFIVGTRPEWAKRHKYRLEGSFVAVSVAVLTISCVLAYRQEVQNEQRWANVTGGDSFPVVVPQGEEPVVRLVVWNFGAAPLTGVLLRIQCSIGESKAETVGTIPAHSYEELSAPLEVQRCADFDPVAIPNEVVATFLLDLSAQNGHYHELLQFKKSKVCQNKWPYRFSLDTGPSVGFAENGKEPQLLDGGGKRLYVAPEELKGWVGERSGDKLC